MILAQIHGSDEWHFSSIWYWLGLQILRDVAGLECPRWHWPMTMPTAVWEGSQLGLLTTASWFSSMWCLHVPWAPPSMVAGFQEARSRNDPFCLDLGQQSNNVTSPAFLSEPGKSLDSRGEEVGSASWNEKRCTCTGWGRILVRHHWGGHYHRKQERNT